MFGFFKKTLKEIEEGINREKRMNNTRKLSKKLKEQKKVKIKY
jgi:hypothetical protein